MERADPDEPVGLDAAGYERLRRHAGTYRERLLVRLCGEVGLRPAETVRVRPGDVVSGVGGGGRVPFLRVRGDERVAHLPEGVERELRRYARAEGVDDDGRLVDVTPRRVQMLVSEAADRAADETDRAGLGAVSTADLRRYHARSLLAAGVRPGVVLAVGGWRRLDGLVEVPAPDPDALAGALPADRDFGSTDDPETTRPGGRHRAALDGLDRAVALVDADGRVTYANRRFERLADPPGDDPVGCPLGTCLPVTEPTRAAMWDAARAGERWRGTLPAGGADGSRAATFGPLGTGGGYRLAVEGEAGASAPPSSRDRLARVQAAAAAVGERLAAATTPGAVARATCEGLAGEGYELVWVSDPPVAGGTSSGSRVRARAAAEGTAVDRPAGDDGPGARLAEEAVRAGESRTEPIGDAPGADASGTRSGRTLVAVPLAHGEDDHGALCAVAPAPPGDRERAALANLGRQVGAATAAVEWKRLLLADEVVELEFRTDDPESPFAAGSARLGCPLRLEGVVPLEGGSLLYYVTVAGASPEAALSVADEVGADGRLIADHGGESLIEVTGTGAGSTLPATLIEHGGNVRRLVAEAGEARLVCEVATTADARGLVEELADASPGADLVAKRETERAVRTPAEFGRGVDERLTDRQRSVLQAAYHAGYFDWPRDSTAEELADSVGVSSPTLHNHLRRAQQKLLAAYFDDGE